MDQAQIQYRVRRTCCEMLYDRKCILLPYGHFKSLREVYDQSFDSFCQQYPSFAWQLIVNSPKQKIATLCLPEFKAAHEQAIIETVKLLDLNRLILIVNSQPKSNQMTRIFDLESKHKVQIEVFTNEQLVLNVTKHFLVPRHSVLTEEGKQQVLNKYQVTEKQMPIILSSDPIAKYLGLNSGQMVQISRESEQGGKYLNFRICK
ncbi:RNA_polymerase II subunit Rpb5a [Hexamita inflata]|uniref:RNA polymerase II subunit Rpb5a n=1 Tax=Hexamita inflata TaxID=28002 RepID=A0AA86QBV3_9EUKA|nr:RNA polymerase II subunit Rpb5a [Hexamita inflata]